MLMTFSYDVSYKIRRVIITIVVNDFRLIFVFWEQKRLFNYGGYMSIIYLTTVTNTNFDRMFIYEHYL